MCSSAPLQPRSPALQVQPPAPYSLPTNVNNVTSGGHANRTGV